jgi:hypothetical protein
VHAEEKDVRIVGPELVVRLEHVLEPERGAEREARCERKVVTELHVDERPHEPAGERDAAVRREVGSWFREREQAKPCGQLGAGCAAQRREPLIFRRFTGCEEDLSGGELDANHGRDRQFERRTRVEPEPELAALMARDGAGAGESTVQPERLRGSGRDERREGKRAAPRRSAKLAAHALRTGPRDALSHARSQSKGEAQDGQFQSHPPSRERGRALLH